MQNSLLGFVACALAIGCSSPEKSSGAPAPTQPVEEERAEAQPLAVHARRLMEAFDYLGSPLPREARTELDRVLGLTDDAALVREVQRVLDAHALVEVTINPEQRVKVSAGAGPRELVEQGWRTFLVKVTNQAGSTAALQVHSPQAAPLHGSPANQVRDRWLELYLFDKRPLAPTLSGLEVEYRILQVGSRDAGKRSAVLTFDIGQGTQDLGFRSDVVLTFDCAPSTPVTFRVRDENGAPTTASFIINDTLGRLYPSPAKRLAPDFAFQPQVYRADGESVRLPQGTYSFTCRRGPEYLVQERSVEVGEAPVSVAFELERWVDPAAGGWWSGDHHIHAAGCMHYDEPTQGVSPADMIRHTVGEDLKVGAALTWGPCFDFQKQFFTGASDPVSEHPYLLRYDIEVSGFGSHESGHLVLLRLKDQMYPGSESKDHWPTLGLNTLRWAKAQGAVCGPAHSGFGLWVPSEEIPSYERPAFDGIGANEYIVDVTHLVPGPDGKLVPTVDFLSTVDTPAPQELNIWYHTLNCGFRTRISGETDFPCIFGDRPGLGRSYAKLDGELSYDEWCEAIRRGRAYVSDGFSHLMDFRVDDREVGTEESELRIDTPTTVRVSANVAARLDPVRTREHLPPWNLEWARIAGSRDVLVECVVNGYPVAEQRITADGATREVVFDVAVERSSWVALRILPSSHTNPVFVLVEDRPIRASRRSAQWCLDGVEQCWSQKQRFYAEAEMEDAVAAYAHARATYRRILEECEVD